MGPRLLFPSICLLTAIPLPAQAPVGPEQFAAAAQWFDTLGFPTVADKPFVRAATGDRHREGRGPRQNTFVHGVLLADDGQRFTVWTLTLATRTFTRTPPGTAEHERVGYTVESLRDLAGQAVAALRSDAAQDPPLFASPWQPFGGTPAPSRAVTRFAVAWACHHAGDRELAHELAGFAWQEARPRTGTLRDVLARDLAHVMMWRLVVDFGRRERPFVDLLADCERFLQQFPDSAHAERARETQAILTRMVAEERAHPQLPPDADREARIRELVFQLRDQNGQQWSQPGACDVFADPRGEQSPAHRLVAIGYPAVPFLLPALEDDSFTRCVGFHRDFHFSHEVLRVRDVATAVLLRITGSWLTTRAEGEQWWSGFLQRGERATRIADAEGGNLAQAERLLRSEPEHALAPLAKALTKETNPWQRERLVALAAGVAGDEALALLRAELQRGAMPVRVTAAVALCRRGHRDEAVDAMVAAWGRILDSHEADLVGSFLAACGAVRAIAALATQRQRLDGAVLLALVDGHARLPDVHLPDGRRAAGHEPFGMAEAGADEAVEQLLGSLLDDGTVWPGTWGSTVDPTTGDFAALALRRRWPGRYEFDLDAPGETRQRQRLLAGNVWRQRQGLPALPLPERPVAPPFDRTQLDDLLGRARRETLDAARHAVFDRIEALGPGALPEVVAEAAVAGTAARRSEWQALASRIASHVRAVRLAPDSAPFPADVDVAALALQGTRLDARALAGVLATIGGGDDDEAARAEVTVARPSDGSGVVLTFAFGRGARGDARSVHRQSSVSAGTRNLHHTTGVAVRESAGLRSYHDDFARALAEALQAPADQPVAARCELVFRE